MRKAALLSVCGLVAACGGAGDGNVFNQGNGQTGGNGNPIVKDAGTLNADGAFSGCSTAAKLIYVIDDQGILHSFYPPTLTFTTIGPVRCPGANGTNSMAIDRDANAWISDNSGALFLASTSDASCKATAFQKGQNGWRKFGMGFATDTPGGTSETLYVSENSGIYKATDGKGLGKIDLSTFKLSPIGSFDGTLSGYSAELTGTGDAQLFGFFTTSPAAVSQIDMSSAHIMSDTPQTSVDTGTDWAFSFWGGDFYMYTAYIGADPSQTTNVTRYRPSDGSTSVVMNQIGFRIVGAGVSTCAPTMPVLK